MSADDYDCGFILSPLTFAWSATDDSGYVRYSLQGPYEGFPALLTNSTRTSYTDPEGGINEDANTCGGGAVDNGRYRLTAKDAAGNATTHSIYGHFVGVTQENNVVDSDYETFGATIAYSAGWRASTYSGYSDGATMKSTTAGATATVTLTTYGSPHLGLVMSTGPTRGSFQVYVDGALQATVSTYASTSRDRVITWQQALKPGTHQVKIVNLATAGHPGIYLDAVLTNS